MNESESDCNKEAEAADCSNVGSVMAVAKYRKKIVRKEKKCFCL